jgi:curved DNA-binding protein CbpA
VLARTLFRTYHKARLRVIPVFSPTTVLNPPPQPSSPAFIVQQRLAFAVVVLGYLVWTTIQPFATATPSLYHLLNIHFDADEATMKTAFRNFAKYNHPDKVGSQGEALFIAVRDAFEALRHPVKRFAYDRFGPDALSWQGVETPRDYVMRGLMASSGFYISTSFFLVLYAAFGADGVGACVSFMYPVLSASADHITVEVHSFRHNGCSRIATNSNRSHTDSPYVLVSEPSSLPTHSIPPSTLYLNLYRDYSRGFCHLPRACNVDGRQRQLGMDQAGG